MNTLEQLNNELKCELGPLPDGDPFHNWLNGNGKEDFIWLLRSLQDCDCTPGHIRYALQSAFQAGEHYGHARSLAAMAKSLPVPGGDV